MYFDRILACRFGSIRIEFEIDNFAIREFFRRRPSIEPLNLQGAAETANGIEKYGHMGYLARKWLALQDSPRTSGAILNIGVPQVYETAASE